MKFSSILQLSGGFAATTALTVALMASVGAANAAGQKIFSLTPKAPVASKQAPNARQIVIEPRQQNSTTTQFVAPKAPLTQTQPQLATLEPDNNRPIVADNSDDTGNKPVIEKPAQPLLEQKVEKPAPETKKPVDLKHLAKGDRVFETENQFIVMHKDGTYDLIARKVHRKVATTYDTYSYNGYNGYSSYNTYNNYSSSYDSYAPSYSSYGYDNCQ